MRAPAFWWRASRRWPARLLRPFGWIYGAITLARMRRPGARAGVPVICVGNFVAGGAGKTPTAIALIASLAARGETPFVLTRGYGGALAGPIEVDPTRHRAADVGDEPLLLAAHARTIVARDRPTGAALACSLGASVVVMDDGLQNPALAKDLRIAVVDGMSGVGNGLCIPAGPLRAPLGGQLDATDAVVVIGEGAAGAAVAAASKARGRPVLGAGLRLAGDLAALLDGRRVLAVSGIGRPDKFRATLAAANAEIVTERRFPDHHAYTAGDVSELLAEATRHGCAIATTEKDITKLLPLWPDGERERLITVPVVLVFDAPDDILALIDRVLSARSAAAGRRSLSCTASGET